MLANYAMAARISGSSDFQHVADEIVVWLEREMNLDGLYCSALDADTEGEEGTTYTWTWSEVRDVLGDRAVAFMEAYGFSLGGNFEDEATGETTGRNIPMLELTPSSDPGEFGQELSMLLSVRLRRPQPARDDKAIVGHNGLLIAAFTLAGRPDLAANLAAKLTSYFLQDDEIRIPRAIVRGKAVGDAFLEDLAGLSFGFAILAEADPGGNWSAAARELAQAMLNQFWDEEAKAFFTTGEHQEKLFGRIRPVFDQPAPSATALAVRALVRAGFPEQAQAALAGVAGWMERVPQATEALHTAYLELLSVREVQLPADDGVRLWIEWLDYPRFGTLHFEIPEGWHIALDTLNVQTSAFAVKLLFNGDQGIGTWNVPFSIDVPPEWTGKATMTVRWQVCSETECLPLAERQWQMAVNPS
jgi:uncharacterized protein YyaL (SSP411 family)